MIFCQDPTETTEVSSFVVGQLNAGISPGRQLFVALPNPIIAPLAFRGDESPSAPFDRGGARVFGRGGHRIRQPLQLGDLLVVEALTVGHAGNNLLSLVDGPELFWRTARKA